MRLCAISVLQHLDNRPLLPQPDAMSHIYIYSPSGALRDKAALRLAEKRLHNMGHDVELDPDAKTSDQRFAGDDDTRLLAISRAAASGADIALISRGGYGLTRILPELPYKQIAKAINKGTQFVGLSDFTALQCALLAKTGAVSWAGPAVGEDFGTEETPDDIMEACFDDLACGQGEGSGWQLPKSDLPALAARRKTASEATPALKVSDATLWGGNLTVLTALAGSPYLPDFSGKILFLEDVSEAPYRIDRMLSTLRLMGALDQVAGVIFGECTECDPGNGYGSLTLPQIFDDYFKPLKVPVYSGALFGHIKRKFTLPLGVAVEVDAIVAVRQP